MQHNTTQRFEADTRSVHLENILVGVIVAVVGPAGQYLSGVQNPLLLVALAIGGFIAGYGLYTLRNYYRAAISIEITSSDLMITTRRRQLQIPWSEMRDVARLPGPALIIHVHNRRQPHTVLLEGYSKQQILLILAQIKQHRT
jgi:hypothetical protein